MPEKVGWNDELTFTLREPGSNGGKGEREK